LSDAVPADGDVPASGEDPTDEGMRHSSAFRSDVVLPDAFCVVVEYGQRADDVSAHRQDVYRGGGGAGGLCLPAGLAEHGAELSHVDGRVDVVAGDVADDSDRGVLLGEGEGVVSVTADLVVGAGDAARVWDCSNRKLC
jgi:hypothetical protein